MDEEPEASRCLQTLAAMWLGSRGRPAHRGKQLYEAVAAPPVRAQWSTAVCRTTAASRKQAGRSGVWRLPLWAQSRQGAIICV